MRGGCKILIGALLACNLWAARAPEPIYPNLWVHDHFLAQPKAASLNGNYAYFGLSGDSLALGSVSVPFPLELPKERGEILHNPLPTYSHRAGFSEWGIGWASAFTIHRYSDIGEVDCTGNLFMSPWGKLQLNIQGNAYYPKGLDLDLRVIKNSDGFTAYHPDGRTFYFTEIYANFAWYLREIKDRTGHVTSYVYERNASERPVLKTVQYGGKKQRQYEIQFLYEVSKTPVHSFESCGIETTIEKTVKQIALRSWNGQAFQTTKKIQLTHKNRYLIQIDTEFPSGDKLPAIQYHYDGFEKFLRKPPKVSKTNFYDLVQEIIGRNYFLTSLAYVDINQDGLLDFEIADNLKSYIQRPDGQFELVQEFSPKTIDPICFRADLGARRLLLRPSGPEDKLSYLLLVNEGRARDESTKIAVCSLEGKLLHERQLIDSLDPGFSLRESAYLVDLNGDLKPDLVRVAYNEYAYFLNESTQTEIKFSQLVKKTLPAMNDIGAKAYFFAEVNGDRFIDLVAQTRFGIMVWYGKGNLIFGPEAVNIEFRTPWNPNLDLMSADLTFFDVNRDGLTDVLFYNGTESHFFINKKDHFVIEYFNQFHEKRPGIAGDPRILNFNGTADDQLLMWAGMDGFVYYDLNSASTGLLTKIDNGQGIVLDFEYQWTKPKPGVPRPIIVPKALTINTAGKGSRKTEYEFIDPRVNLATGQLIGFGQVKTKDSQILVQTDFITSTEHSPKPIETRKQDERVAGLIEVEAHYWQPALLDGIPYAKLVKSIQAYFGESETIVRRSVDFLNHDRLCANHTRESTSLGILDKLVSYFDPRACLKSNETLVGSDFIYTTLTDYNKAGLPTNLELVSGAERLPKMTLAYDNEFNLKNITQPGRGTTFLEYDPVFEILSSLRFPDGTWRNMTGYLPEVDAVSGLSSKGSSTDLLSQSFVYDEFHRLKHASSNLGQQSEYAYRLPNQTAPGVLSEAFTKTAILSSADGESLTQGKQSQTGWYFGPLDRKNLTQNKEQQIGLSSLPLNASEFTFQDLESANTVLSETDSSELFGILARDFVVNSNHRNYITTRFEVDAVGFKATSKENNQYITRSILDLSTSQPVSYTDELNQTYTYGRDVLGRLRNITLPDGNTQMIDFDGFGRVSNITRSNISAVVYVYDNANDRLAEKTVLGVRETYEYDAAGRMEILRRGSEQYKFDYEGSAVAGVKHTGFTKKFAYTPDDKPEIKSLKTKSGLSIDLEFGYDTFRNLIEQNVSNQYTKNFVYDDYRQLGLVRIGNQTFSIARDSQGKIEKIDLPNNQTFRVAYDSLTHGRMGHSSQQGSYGWNLNDRGLINGTRFTSSANTCAPRMLSFVYAADKTLLEPSSALRASADTAPPRASGLYDENRHRIGKYSGDKLEHIRFDGIVATAEHIYEKFSIEGIDLGILIDGQFQPCLFDQVGSLLAIGDFVSIPSAFGERAEYQPIFEYFDYAGQGRDPETGFIAMGERDYDPRTHQFTSPDRFFLESPEECVRSPQECNLFSYAKNNPLIYTDEDGQNARVVQAIGTVGYGVATNYPAVKSAAIDLYRERTFENVVRLTGEVLLPATRLGRAVLNVAHKAETSEKLIYRDAGYHHKNSRGEKSPAPTNGQATLDKSLRIKETSPWRIGVDSRANEIVIFSHTDEGRLFHGHVRSWTELDQGQQSVLRKSGLVNKNGKILGRD